MVDALILIAVIGVGLVALHNVALWAERHGWIFYKYRKASPGTAGRAFLEAQSLLEPGKQHVVQSQREDDSEQEQQGEPPWQAARGARTANSRCTGREPLRYYSTESPRHRARFAPVEPQER